MISLYNQVQHLAIAALTHETPDKQVIKMAKRYRAKSIKPMNKRAMLKVIKHETPAKLVLKTEGML